MADGSLKFDTKIDTDGFEKGINTLEKIMGRLSSAIEDLSINIKNAFSGVSTTETTKVIDDTKEAIDRTDDSAKRMEESMKNIDDAIARMNSEAISDIVSENEVAAARELSEAITEIAPPETIHKIDEIKKETSELGNAFDFIKQTVSSIPGIFATAGNGIKDAFASSADHVERVATSADDSNQKIKALVDELDRYKDALYHLEGRGLYFGDKEYDDAYRGLKKAESALVEYKRELMGLDSQQKRTTLSTRKLNETLRKTTKTSIPLTKSIFKLSNMFKLLVLRMMMRSVIKAVQEGFQNLAQYSNQANKDMSALKTSMQTLQNSFATAFAPILTAVTPALQTLIGHLSQAITLLGQFFATLLTGATTFTKAKDAQVDYAKSIAKMAKEANQALSPIDKLNTVGGSETEGYVGPTPGDMFEEVEIDTGVIEFAEKVKELMKPTIDSLGRLAEALKPVGEFAFDNLKNFYKDFLKPVGEWVLGEGLPGLTDALSKLFENVDWKNLSDALGKLYKALEPMAKSIGKGFIQFVKDLAEFLNPILSTTVDALAIALGALADIISNVDPETWEKAGYAIGVVGTAIAGIKIVTGLTAFLTKLGKGFSTFAAGLANFANLNPVALPALFDLLGLDEWGNEFYDSLPQWMRDLWEGFWGALETILRETFTLDKAMGIFREMVSVFKTAFDSDGDGENDPWYKIGWNIIKGILLGIYGAFTAVAEAIANFFELMWKNLKSVFGIKSPAKKMEPIGKNILLGILEGFKNTFSKWWSAIVDWGKSTVSRFGVQMRSIWYEVKKPFLSAKDWFKGKFTDVWNAIKKVFEPVGKWFGDIWDGIKSGFSKAMWGLKDLAKAPINAVITLLNKLIDAINSINFSMPNWGWLPDSVQGQSVGFNLKRIPKLASGTVVPANYGEFLAILGDNKREAEVVSPLSTMKQALKEAMMEMGGAGTGEIHIYLEGDAKGVFKLVRAEESNHYKQTGQAVFIH